MPAEQAEAEIMGPRYAEQPLFEATMPNPQGEGDVPVKLFANAATGTWTLMLAPSARVRCIIMAGKDFRPAILPKIGKGT